MRGCEDNDHSLEGKRGRYPSRRDFYIEMYEGATQLPPWSQNLYMCIMVYLYAVMVTVHVVVHLHGVQAIPIWIVHAGHAGDRVHAST
jgi:hypothetical protein